MEDVECGVQKGSKLKAMWLLKLKYTLSYNQRDLNTLWFSTMEFYSFHWVLSMFFCSAAQLFSDGLQITNMIILPILMISKLLKTEHWTPMTYQTMMNSVSDTRKMNKIKKKKKKTHTHTWNAEPLNIWSINYYYFIIHLYQFSDIPCSLGLFHI